MNLEDLDYFVFHCPYSKLVQKSFARLAFNDFLRDPENAKYEAMAPFKDLPRQETYTNRDIEKAFMGVTKDSFVKKVSPCLVVPKNTGNMYCGSVYGGLVSLIAHVDPEQLLGKRVALFSYGSGLAASMFSLKFVSSTADMAQKLNVPARLASRSVVDPAVFDQVMLLREQTHNAKSYVPVASAGPENLFPGTYYLESVDDKFRRSYKRTPSEATSN